MAGTRFTLTIIHIVQHTPAVQVQWIHDHISEFIECSASQWLCHVVSDHVLGWTVLNMNFLSVNQICDVKILDMKMSSPFS